MSAPLEDKPHLRVARSRKIAAAMAPNHLEQETNRLAPPCPTTKLEPFEIIGTPNSSRTIMHNSL